MFGEHKISNSWKMSHVRSAAWERVPVRRLSPITFDYSTLELTVPSTSRPIYLWALEALQPSSPFNGAGTRTRTASRTAKHVNGSRAINSPSA